MFNPLSSAIPFLPSAALSDDDRDKAFKRTARTLRELDDIRKALELPPDALRIVHELYLLSTQALAIEREAAELEARTERLPMRIDATGPGPEPLRILQNQTCQITTRPQWSSYRVEEIEIHGDPSHWIVHGIRVGNSEQAMAPGQPGPYPGELFRKGGIMSDIRLETCQTGMDFVLIVEYIGPDPKGATFEATAVGMAVRACC